MKILHISDTHGTHYQFPTEVFKGVDVLIHSGDATNHRSPYLNEEEFFDFLDWYTQIDVKHKIYVAGNHDTYIEKFEKNVRLMFENAGVHYLNKDEVVIDGVKFYGDPHSPTFGDWVFMSRRDKIGKHWTLIPEDVNVLITHTPPKRHLDLTENYDHSLEQVGCESLRKRVEKLSQLKLHCFGHIHDSKNVTNSGVLRRGGVMFSNGSCVEDGRMGIAKNFGNLIEI